MMMANFLVPRYLWILAFLVVLLSTVGNVVKQGWTTLQYFLGRPIAYSCPEMPGLAHKTHFATIQRIQADYAPTLLTQYKSERTGMHVVVVDQKGPKVLGYFALATEILDDSGAPHTLEHLIFMGSKNYQYKGLLDKLANRAYSDTNAWTSTDHTAYTLDTAGWEGFAQILPVYLEHVILPTLTDEGCYTEVHHIDGEGNDAGVVYSEMQGIQNNGPELMDLEARRLLYPANVGFRYETGGMMEQLRNLTPERIRAFHKEMYQPKNLCLIIVGEVDHDNLLSILDEFEGGILDEVPSLDAPFRRPWIDSPQPPDLTKSVVKIVEFPEGDESVGDILIGFLGPDCNDVIAGAAMNILLTYLSGSSVSILENTIVEKEQLASSISTWWDARPKSVIWFQPTSVATEKLAEVEKRLFEVLKDVSSKPLNMSYIRDCVNRERRQLKFQAESSQEFFAKNVINDFLFGKSDGSTLKDLASLKEYDVLETWTDQQWRYFLKHWISDAEHVSILGKPSKTMVEKLKKDEISRLASRREELGEAGLQKLAKKLERAKAKNDAPVPNEILERWPVPGVSSIHFIESTTARSGLARKLGVVDNPVQKIIDKEMDLPLFIQFEDIPTNFVSIAVFFGTSTIPLELLPLISIFMDNFFNIPVNIKGKRIEFEEVVMQLEKDTVNYSISGGQRGESEDVVIRFQVEPDKYAQAIEWIRTLIHDSIFDETRLHACNTKILADIPWSKRSGGTMASAVSGMVHLAPESLSKARNTLVLSTYSKRLKRLLSKSPDTVISMLESLRSSLFTFPNTRILVVANVSTLSQPLSSWSTLLTSLPNASAPILPIYYQHEHLSPDGQKPGLIGALIIPMPTIDSSYLLSSAAGLTSYTDPQLPALMVAISYLAGVEGPLWRAVRGTGLAYGTSFSRDIEGGMITFSIYRSPDAYKAFIASKEIVESFASGKAAFEKAALEGAVSSIVVGLADEQATMGAAAGLSFINSVVRGLGKDYGPELLRSVRKVGVEDIRLAIRRRLSGLFEVGNANLVITCAPVMEEGIVKGFGSLGYKTQVQPLSHFREDYGLKGEEGEELEDDDEDEDEDEDMEEDEDEESGDGEL